MRTASAIGMKRFATVFDDNGSNPSLLSIG